MAVEVVIDEAQGGSCWGVGVHQDGIYLENIHDGWQAQAYKIFLWYKGNIEVDLNFSSDLFYLIVREGRPLPQNIADTQC